MQATESLTLAKVLESYDVVKTSEEILIKAKDFLYARIMQTSLADDFVRLARKENRRIRITWHKNGQEQRGFQFHDWMPINQGSEEEDLMFHAAIAQDANYLAVLDFMKERYEEGKIVILTTHIMGADPTGNDDICSCIHTNDKLLPSRASLKPYQFQGYDYLKSWRCLPEGGISPAPSPEYQDLRSRLNKDGYVPGFEYTLKRPDGAFCRYSTDYYLIEDYCGQPIRIGVSAPEDWSLIR